jgi:hypothetical protein
MLVFLGDIRTDIQTNKQTLNNKPTNKQTNKQICKQTNAKLGNAILRNSIRTVIHSVYLSEINVKN